MPQNFDVEAFHAALNSQRLAIGLTWKEVAAQAGVSASTLTRMTEGKRPDADGLAALLRWSGLKAENFFVKGASEIREEAEPLAQITAVLRADASLDKDSASAIEEILKAAYFHFRKKPDELKKRI